MPNYNKSLSATSVRLGEVRFGYVNVFAPRRNEDGSEGKYSVQIMIPKSDTAAKKLIDEAIKAAANAGVSSKFNGKMPRNLKTPLRDGDEEYPEDDNYAGMWFMNATSSAAHKPGVIMRGEDGRMSECFSTEDFYSGCYGATVVNFYAYNVSGNQGVACGLNNVIKTRDGESLGGSGHSAAQDFGDLCVMDDEPNWMK